MNGRQHKQRQLRESGLRKKPQQPQPTRKLRTLKMDKETRVRRIMAMMDKKGPSCLLLLDMTIFNNNNIRLIVPWTRYEVTSLKWRN